MHYHVYRHDHAGRGVQANPHPFTTYGSAESWMIVTKRAEAAAHPGEPGRVYYLVSEDPVTGERFAYPDPPTGPAPYVPVHKRPSSCHVCGAPAVPDWERGSRPDCAHDWTNAEAEAEANAHDARVRPVYPSGATSAEAAYVERTRGR